VVTDSNGVRVGHLPPVLRAAPPDPRFGLNGLVLKRRTGWKTLTLVSGCEPGWTPLEGAAY
jgi:hypothetical protein